LKETKGGGCEEAGCYASNSGYCGTNCERWMCFWKEDRIPRKATCCAEPNRLGGRCCEMEEGSGKKKEGVLYIVAVPLA
jgi:hypothetical protein